MNLYEFNQLCNEALEKIFLNQENYLAFLRVVSNNYEYNFRNLLSIYRHFPNGKSLYSYNDWRFNLNRSVVFGSKGTPILHFKNNYNYILHYFDVSQTNVIDPKLTNVKQYKTPYRFSNINQALHDLLLEKNNNDISGLEEKTIQYVNETIDKKYKSFNENTICFLKQSITYTLGLMFDQNFNTKPNFEILKSKNAQFLYQIGSIFSNEIKSMVKTIIEKEKLYNYQQTKAEIAGYNVDKKREDFLDGNAKKEIHNKSDRTRSSNTTSMPNIERFSGKDGGINFSQDKSNFRSSPSGDRRDLSKSHVRSGEIELSSEFGERGTLLYDSSDVSQWDTSPTRSGQTVGVLPVHRENKTSNDGKLGDHRGTESQRSDEMGRSYEQPNKHNEQNGTGRNSLHKLESIQLDFEESSREQEKVPFFYSKDNPRILITDEMLDRVPKIYDQEKIKNVDKVVHAAYFIPFRNWTWYLTEYDKESGNAFGLVLGDEAKWGYFNIDELRELNAQRLILEDFPKTFRELKDTELKKQIDEFELNSLFNGELSFQEEPIKNKVNSIEEIFRLNNEINEVLSGNRYIYNSIKILNHTPKILLNIGLKDLPILYSQKHLKNVLHEKGLNPHWHGLNKNDILDIPNQLESPAIIMDSLTRNDSIVVITEKTDVDNLPIIISLKENGIGNYEMETISTNYITSIYGKNNLENFVLKNIEKNNILYLNKEKIQSLERSSKLQLLRNFSDFEFNKIIHQSKNIGNIIISKTTENNTEVKVDLNNNLSSQTKLNEDKEETIIQNNLENSNSLEIKDKLNTNESISKTKYNKNFVITEEVQAEKLTPSERLNNNIEAISMLKRLDSGERELDYSVQEVLAKYVGWGGLADVFDEDKKGQWEVARNFLKENLSSQEYENAKESTLTAFYTPKVVIDSIYKGLENIDFKGGNILEPSLGIGNFIGNIPKDFTNSKVYGIELDSISGRIAKYLYPESNIQVKGFEETTFSNNFFDVAIGNVPFGDYKVSDREYDKNNFLIHDYFFAKAIDKVRPGGVIAFITSSGTMDKKDDSVRRYINSRAEFLGAIRLPNDTFKGVAGTEVTSDIIFLKKRESIFNRSDDWIHLANDKNLLRYNKYFVDNPDMVLGDMTEIGGRFGNDVTCAKKENVDLKDLLNKAILNIVGTYEKVDLINDEETFLATDNVKNFSYTLVDDEVYYRTNSAFQKENITEKEKEVIKDYLKLKETLKDVIKTQKEDYEDSEIQKSQEKLNEVYDSFAKKHKFINSRQNTKLLEKDSDFPLISSIEKIEDGKFKQKGDIFFKRTIAKSKIVDRVDTAGQALILSVAATGRVDLQYMSSLLDGKAEKDIIKELKGQIFLDTAKYDKYKNDLDFDYVTADEYLSGNIRKKIESITKYHNDYFHKLDDSKRSDSEKEEIKVLLDELKYQKEKLEEVMPKALTASEINVRLGATWIPTDDIKTFMVELLQISKYKAWDINIRYSAFTSEWNVEGKSVDKYNDLANLKYGTTRVNAYKLIEDCLNLRETKVWDQIENPDGSKSTVLNKKETILANQKQELIKEEFKNFIFKDPERRHRLEKIYNEKFNSVVNREFDSSNLLLDGKNIEIELRPHQKDAIARTLFGGNTLLAHVVGAGKTYEMVASAMESKRLGMCSKSLFVVPNHLTEQIGREFMELYPSANIMVATKKDFETQNRKRFIGRIATGEYDAVIIGHTQFEKIPMSKEYQENHIKKQIDEIIKYINQYKYNNNLKFTVKELQKTRKKLEVRLKKLNDDFKKDDLITFEELGVDKLFIDEAHSYKNLFLYTKMRNVAGIGQSEALKSSDMFMKCRYLDEMTNGKGVVFATGTPVSNSMTELYTMQRYLQYETLKEKDLEHFDSWASTFGETVSAVELSPEGDKYRVKTRFSKFYNLPELMSMFKDVANIKTADMLNLPTPKANYETIVTKPTEEQKEILKALSERADKVRDKKVEPEKDNMLKITNDGKKLALDQRLINPLLPDDENSKVNVCVKNIFSIWDKTKENRSTQLVFSDMSTPKGDGEFNIYDDIKNKLVNLGIPEKEIAFIHDANNEKQKDELFAKVRKGDVRVLLGSTQKMGAGTNVQDKLIALHDVDVPWRPSDLEQRAGRIVRQGNENKEVNIYRYVTENTFDSYLWQTIENKQRFISQIMTSKSPVRVAEDVDENTLSYAEIKALATGNPLIKEKMDLDVEVTKLKMLEANHKSNIYTLEDKILKQYPIEIKQIETMIEALRKDISTIEPQGNGDNKFTSITINNNKIIDKKLAGQELLKEISKTKVGERRVIGNYRNFKLEVSYNLITSAYNFVLKGATNHLGEFGTNPDGNITRLDNVIDKITEKLKRFEQNLINTKLALENAKIEVEKPFNKAEELKEKTLRLAEINSMLDIGGEQEKENDNPLLEDVKKAIIDFCNLEYEENHSYDEFDTLFPNLKHIGLAYTNTPDEKHSIQYELNLEDKTWTQYIDEIPIKTESFDYENKGEDVALKNMKNELELSTFSDLVYVDSDDLKTALGLEIDDEGNFYDPNLKDLELEKDQDLEEDYGMEM